MNPSRRDHAISVEEGERVVDGLYRQLATEVGAIVREVGTDDPMTAAQHAAIMRRVDRALDRPYPPTPAAGSRLEEAIVLMSNRARVRAVKRTMHRIAPLVRQDPQLRQALDDGNR